MEWRTNTRNEVLRVVGQQEQARYDHGYLLEVGTTLFELAPEDMTAPA